MALTGNLEIFPMPEVLRLLSRSKKSGCLRVDNGELDGRVYLDDGAISFANTDDDERIRRALVSAGLVTEDGLRSIAGTDTPLTDALASGVEPSDLTDFVREQVVESLYRIRKPGHGDFEFVVDLAPVFRTGQQFDIEIAVSESDRRASEWSEVLSVVDDLDAPVRMVRSLPDENSVTIAAPTWKVLASLEGGTSIRQLATRTGLSEFRAARELSGLIRGDLVEVVPGAPSVDDGYRAPVIERTPIVEEEAREPEVDEAGSTWSEPTWEVPEDSDEGADEPDEAAEAKAEESGAWFAEATGESDMWGEESAVDDDESDDASSDGGWWATAVETPAGETDESDETDTEDTDGFLESVFSQLNDVPEGDEDEDHDETGFSMGLLRRRRMGTAARDITND